MLLNYKDFESIVYCFNIFFSYLNLFLCNYVLCDIFLYQCLQKLFKKESVLQMKRLEALLTYSVPVLFIFLRADANRPVPAGGEYRHPGAPDRAQPAGAVSLCRILPCCGFLTVEHTACVPLL